MKKTALFTTAALVAMAGIATAGTPTAPSALKTTNVKIAKEEVDGQTAAAPLVVDMSSFMVPTITAPVAPATTSTFTGGVVVTPNAIPLTTLSNGVMNFTVGAGKWVVTQAPGEQLQICDDQGVPQLVFKTGSNNSIVFDAGNNVTLKGTSIAGNISNGKNYAIMFGDAATDCSTTSPAALLGTGSSIGLAVPPATAKVGLTVSTGIATTQTIYDVATGTIATVDFELAAAVTKQAGLQIDFSKNFAQLFDPNAGVNVANDTIGVKVTSSAPDVRAYVADGDQVVTTITVSDPTGLKLTGGTATGADTTAAPATKFFGTTTCADIDANGKIVCTSTADSGLTTPPGFPAEEDFTYKIVPDGTVAMTEKTFNVTTEYLFKNVPTLPIAGYPVLDAAKAAQDRSVANSTALLVNAAGGSWRFRGTTVYVPLIKEGNGANTFIKLQSKATAGVRGLVLCSDGVSRAVDLGTITAGTPKVITSTQIVAALGATGTVDAANGYAMTLSITSDKANVFGYANTVDAAGNAKRIPLSTESGVSN